jgi:putative transposase
MPRGTVLDLPPEEQAQILAAVRRARYGYRLGLQSVLLCAAGWAPTDIAAALFCSRSSVYRTVRADRTGTLGWEPDAAGPLSAPIRTTVLPPTRRRSLGALLKVSPQASGWCRTRWSCATSALTLQTQRGVTVSAETVRRWLHELGWVWKRAKLVARDDDPGRVARLARIRGVFEPLQPPEALVFADELDSPLRPTVGWAWMPTGTPVEVMTPGQQQKHYLAGALDLATGTLHSCRGPRNTNALCRDLLGVLEPHSPAERSTQL